MSLLDTFYHWVWGTPLLVLVVGTGVYYTYSLKGLQFRYLSYALKLIVTPDKAKDSEGDISNFESLMTALAGSIGIGNIAGVATAITIGGLGALFWMWITALVGMATKYAEAVLAVKYRSVDKRGEMCGGPMHFIQKGLGWRWLSVSFALFGAIAALGGGNLIQANSVADVMSTMFDVSSPVTGIGLAVIIGVIILGGIKAIGKVASYLVPFMALFYIGGGLVILVQCYEKIPEALMSIFSQAFTGQAAFGGFAGSTMMLAMQIGVSRGLMTSEAGLGTASIVAAAAKTDHPGRQGFISMTGSFLATVVLCSVTALVLAVTGVFGSVDASGKMVNGASLTIAAFQSVFPWGGLIVTIGLILFAITTLLGWAYYGEKCMEFLFGEKVVPFYRVLFVLVVVPGAILDLEIVWKISDISNGLMAFPNLIGLVALSSVVLDETKSFLKIVEFEKAETKRVEI